MNLHKKAFTLVELIVAITILAILGTVSFISLQGYNKSTRDSVRVSNLSIMKTSLELFHLDSGKYPAPTDFYSINYSGSTVWDQGTFGESTMSNVDKLDKIPLDPLIGKEYTYSVTSTKQEYQLGGMIENSLLGLKVLPNQAQAGDTIATAFVVGNYNGQTLKTQSGSICQILSIPTIISGDSRTITDLKEIIDNQRLVYNGYNNLPSYYEGGKFKHDGGFGFTSNKLISYSDTNGCLPLYDAEDPSARITLIKNLQTAYSGTILEDESNIVGLISVNTDNFDSVNLVGASLVNNNLGGKIIPSEAKTIECEAGYHTEDFITCVVDSVTLPTSNGTNVNVWNGSSWELSLATCNIDYYDNGDGTCSSVGTGYYSDSTSMARIACSNKPTSSSYIGDGDGTNSCPWSCNSGFYQSGNSCLAYTYSRVVGGRGGCNVSCGGGTRYRSVICRRNDGTNMSDSYCSGKPATSSSCNTQSCGTPRTHGNDGTQSCSTICAWGRGWCTGFSAGSCGTRGVRGTCYCRK